MLIVLPDEKGVLANCLIVDTDDDRCGLCFGDGGKPIEPEHDYRHHTQVRTPTERYDLITDSYVFWGRGSHADREAWANGLEAAIASLPPGVGVVAKQRSRKVGNTDA